MALHQMSRHSLKADLDQAADQTVR